MSDLNKIPPQQWQALAGSTIYFGHQSVGNNILEATRDLLRENPQIPLRLSSGTSAAVAGMLNEFHVGENGDIESQNVAFISAVHGMLP
jgi:hypothetical protein